MLNTQSNYAAERAAILPSYSVEALSVEEIEIVGPPLPPGSYPHGMTQEEYDALESPHFSADAEEIDEIDGFSTNTYEDGHDPFELSINPCMRAFDNNFTD